MTILDADASFDDLPVLQAYAAPENVNRLAHGRPAATKLLLLLSEMAAHVVQLRDSWADLRRQTAELHEVWTHLSGLRFVAQAQYMLQKLSGNGDDPAKLNFFSAVDDLKLAVSHSKPFVGGDPHGDFCKPDPRAINPALTNQIQQHVNALVARLQDVSLKSAYTEWFEEWSLDQTTPGQLLLLGDEAHVVHMLIADAVEAVCEADPKNAISTVVDKFASGSTESLNSPSTGTVLDIALPSWQRLAVASAASSAGAVVAALGPDGLLVRALLLYCRRREPSLLTVSGGPTLHGAVIPKLAKALGMNEPELEGALREVSNKEYGLAYMHATLKEVRSTSPSGGTPPGSASLESELLTIQERLTKEMAAARKSLKEILEDKHVADGLMHNCVMSILSLVQLEDAAMSMRDSGDLLHTLKAVTDGSVALLQIATTAPVVYFELANSSRRAFLSTFRDVGGKAIPLLTFASGAMQLYSGLTDEGGPAPSDIVCGGLNMISGGALAVYAFGVEVEIAPVIGQVAGGLAFVAGTAVAIADATKTMSECYCVGVLEKLSNARWKHNGMNSPIPELLAITKLLENAKKSASLVSFGVLNPVAGVASREELMSAMTLYAGTDVAKSIVASGS